MGVEVHELEPLRAGIYLRLSQNRERDDTGSLTPSEQIIRHEMECRALVAERGWVVVDVYADDDRSAYSGRARPAWERLLADLGRGGLQAVVAHHADRLYRVYADLERLLAIPGVEIATVMSGEIDLNTAMGRAQARIGCTFSALEVERMAERLRGKKQAAALRGAWQGGQRVFGYQLVPLEERGAEGPLRVVEGEAEVVLEAAARLLAGESLRGIARDLNARGSVTTTGKAWTGSSLGKMLKRPTTAGYRAIGRDQWVDGSWPALLPPDQWLAVRSLLGDPSRKTWERYGRVYLGSGLYRCGVCGGPLGGNTTAGGSAGDRRAAYRCRTTDRDGGVHVVRDVEHLDDHVTQHVLARLQCRDAEPLRRRGDVVDVSKLAADELATLAKMDEAATSWARDELSAAQLSAVNRALTVRLEDIRRSLRAAWRDEAIQDLRQADAVDAHWFGLSLERRRAVVRELLDVVVLPLGRGRVAGPRNFDPNGVRLDWK